MTDAELLALREQRFTYQEIAYHTGLPLSTVWYRCNHYKRQPTLQQWANEQARANNPHKLPVGPRPESCADELREALRERKVIK